MTLLKQFVVGLVKFVVGGIVVLTIVSYFVPGGKGRDIDGDLVPYGEMPEESGITHDVPVMRLISESGKGFCSAVVVDKRYAITAAHCINTDGFRRLGKIGLSDYQGNDTGITAKVAGYDIRTDLGLLVGDFSTVRPAKANFTGEAFSADTIPELMVSCGFPLAQKRVVCTRFTPVKMEYFYVAGVAHLIRGMSGGPVVNVTTDEVVAINSAVNGEGMSIISPIEGALGLFGLE